MKRFNQTAGLIGVSLLALAAPMPVLAQAAPGQPAPAQPGSDTPSADADIGSSDIIVTARRRDERLQDVPAVVNAVTAEEIQKLNFRQFQDVQSVVPGLNLVAVANGTGGGATLRGVNFDINASGNNPTVEFYQNDAPITAGVILQQVYDVGQIEVLRGPQGTLRGRASPSGSITLTTRKPDLYRAGGYASATANDIGTLNFNAALGIPIIEGIAAIRVAGLINQDDFDRVRTISKTAATDRRDPYSETQSGRITAVVNPIDALSFEGSFQRLDRRYRGFDQVESASLSIPGAAASPVLIRGSDRLSNQEQPRTGRQKYDIFNGRAQLALFGQKLIYQFQHYNQNIDSYVSQDYAEALPNYDFGQFTKSRIRSESHEVRLQNDERVLGMFDYVLGAFANTNDVPTDLIVQTPVFLPVFLGGGLATTSISNIQRRGHSNEKSIFGNVTAHFGDATQISGGLRYITYKSQGSLTIPAGASSVTIPDAPVNLKHVIYSAQVQHNFTRNIMVYASTGSSYRPGVDAVGDFSLAQSARERSFLHLQPESSQSYEVGIKTTLFDGRAHANISGYHQTFKNFPYRTPGSIFFLSTTSGTGGNVVSVGNFNFVAAVPVEVNGVEGELGFDFSRQFKVNIVASYSIGRIKDGTIPCNDLNGDGVPDTLTTTPTVAQLQAIPNYAANNLAACKVSQRSAFLAPLSASATAEYTHPLNDHIDGYVRGLVSFNGRSQGDPTNLYDNINAYALTNIYLGVRDPKGQWEINLFAKNVFDDDRTLTRPGSVQGTTVQVLQPPTFRSAAASTLSSTYLGTAVSQFTTTPPREFGVNMKFSFGSR